MKKYTVLIILLITAMQCTDYDDITSPNAEISFKFIHTWENTPLDHSNLNTTLLSTENGEVINISRIRYLISKFELTDENGNSFVLDGYKLIDLSQPSTYNFSPINNTIPNGTYTLKWIWGFNEADNIDGAYPDLNIANWNWPEMLGGGYHFLQLDGTYNTDTSAPNPFNFHHGTARVSTNVFEQNFAEIVLNTAVVVSGNTTINIKMDVSEFFKNPHTWDLNVMNINLMPNYTAQKMIMDNVDSVFSIE